MRSHVRLHVEAGATLFSIKDKNAFDQDALIFGENLENITIEGRGTIDGQAEYEWRPDDIEDDFIRPNKELMLSLGKSTRRSFPKKNQFGKLILLLRCKDVRIAGLSLVNSPSWTIHPYGCERLVIDGVYIRSSLAEGVWADGIDPDGCKDLRISNCTIETGDDALVFYSMNWFGPAPSGGRRIDAPRGRRAPGAGAAAPARTGRHARSASPSHWRRRCRPR